MKSPNDPVVAQFNPRLLKYAGYILAALVVEWWFSMMYIATGMNLIATAYNIPAAEWSNVELLKNGIFFGSIPALFVKVVFILVMWGILKSIQTRRSQNANRNYQPANELTPGTTE